MRGQGSNHRLRFASHRCGRAPHHTRLAASQLREKAKAHYLSHRLESSSHRSVTGACNLQSTILQELDRHFRFPLPNCSCCQIQDINMDITVALPNEVKRISLRCASITHDPTIFGEVIPIE